MLDLKKCVRTKEVQGLVLLQGNSGTWSRVCGQWKYILLPGLRAIQKSDTGTMHIQKPYIHGVIYVSVWVCY